jgi:hypothetical protein
MFMQHTPLCHLRPDRRLVSLQIGQRLIVSNDCCPDQGLVSGIGDAAGDYAQDLAAD